MSEPCENRHLPTFAGEVLELARRRSRGRLLAAGAALGFAGALGLVFGLALLLTRLA